MTETRIESYEGMTREQLIERLTAAEDVCTLVGWTAPGDTSNDREAALTELWMRWSRTAENAHAVKANPHLDDDGVRALAEERRGTRRAALARLDAGITS